MSRAVAVAANVLADIEANYIEAVAINNIAIVLTFK